MGSLNVFLEKVTNLSDQDLLGKSDPYVVFELEQDNMFLDKDFGRKQSSKKKDDCSPVYNESFTFTDLPGLKNLVLNVKIMEDDIVSDDKIGSCRIKLDKLRLDHGPVRDAWVVDNNLFSKDAKIFLKLTWNV